METTAQKPRNCDPWHIAHANAADRLRCWLICGVIIRMVMREPTLDETVDRDAELAWEAEIGIRLKEIDEGKVSMIPWAEARARIAGQ